MREFFRLKKKVRIYHGSTNSTRAQKFKEGEIIDVSQLNRVIDINTKDQYALVEPNVAMDALVDATLKYNLIPPVVMEFPGITVGGGIQGGAVESSSFRQGAFHETCEEYEIILGNGDVISVSPDNARDLFYGTACSYGSLGIITRIKLRLHPAKKFVHLGYYRVESFEEAVELVDRKSKEKVDFIDGIMFRKNLGVIMVGELTNGGRLPIKTFHRARDEWFYLHAQRVAQVYHKWEELIPLRDYLFRYDRGAFWVGQYLFRRFRIPFNHVTRVLLNWMTDTRTLYGGLHAGNISQYFILQDINLLKDRVKPFLDWTDKKFHIYPLWLCPLKPGQDDKLCPACLDTDLVINVGIWGKIPPNSNFLKANRELEEAARNLGGRKMLYAHAYYSKADFWRIYDSDWYQSLRSRYNAAQVFPDLYHKVHVSEKYKASISNGLFNFLKYSAKMPIIRNSKTH